MQVVQPRQMRVCGLGNRCATHPDQCCLDCREQGRCGLVCRKVEMTRLNGGSCAYAEDT